MEPASSGSETEEEPLELPEGHARARAASLSVIASSLPIEIPMALNPGEETRRRSLSRPKVAPSTPSGNMAHSIQREAMLSRSVSNTPFQG